MAQSYFNILVKKLSKHKNKILTIQQIKKIISQILGDNYKDSKTYKNIYYLKNRGYLISLKKDLFFVKSPSQQIEEEELLNRFYRKFLKQAGQNVASSNRYIGDLKALEINMDNYQIPDKVVIINPFKKSTEVVLLGKKALFKKFETHNNIYPKIKRFTQRHNIGSQKFKVAQGELALLETLHSPDPAEYAYIQALVKKYLKRYGKKLQINIFENIIKLGKHHASINRLYKIALSLNPQLAKEFRDIIKKYSFFLEVN